MNSIDILKQLMELKAQIALLHEKTRLSWAYPLIGVMIGSLLSFFANYFVFKWNRKKEDRKHLIQVAAKLTGICRRYGDTAFNVEEARIWQAYIINSMTLGIAPPLSLDIWLEREKQSLKEYNLARSEFEEAFTEYLGIVGFDDEEFTVLVVQLRNSGLGETGYKQISATEEFQKINVSTFVQVRLDHHMHDEKSLNKILTKISSHLRFSIAPI